MPATAEVFKPRVLSGFLFLKYADFRPRLQAEVQGGEAIPHRHQIHPGFFLTTRKRTGGVFFIICLFCGLFCSGFFLPTTPTGDTDWSLALTFALSHFAQQ